MPPLTALTRTGIVFFPAFDWAIDPTHPEREERLLYTRDQIFEEGLLDIDGILEFVPAVATLQDVERVHACWPDSRTQTSDSHLISAGGAITAGRKVLDGEVQRAFALVRPPGHHACRVVRGLRGFCIINIEAVMIEHLRRHYRDLRVAIVDTDCHHGDGTQDVYWHDPDTLFISLHQDGRTLYPGTGFPNEAGGPNAYGTTLNVPLPPGTNDEGYLYVMDHLVRPVLDDWKPDLIINSAGQDNHFSDPLTNMCITARGYAELTRRLRPDIAVLEGGYSVQSALPYINVGILLALAGLDTDHLIEPDLVPGQLQQSREQSDYIARVCDTVLGLYHSREELAAKQFGGLAHHEVDREVFYDGANITESQHEKVRVCGDCPGVVALESQVPGQGRLLAVDLPRRCCPACRAEGAEAYAWADEERFALAELRDRPADRVLRKGSLAREGESRP